MEDSEPQLAVRCGVVGDLGGDASLDLLRIVEDVAADAMCSSWMVEKRIDIIAAIPNHSLSVLQLEHQPRRLFRDLQQKHLIDHLPR